MDQICGLVEKIYGLVDQIPGLVETFYGLVDKIHESVDQIYGLVARVQIPGLGFAFVCANLVSGGLITPGS